MLFEFRVDCDSSSPIGSNPSALSVGMLFEFRVDCDLLAIALALGPHVGMLFEFRVDCDSCCFFSCCFFDVGMLFEFRVDCDFQVRQLQTITFLWECYLNLEWIATYRLCQ